MAGQEQVPAASAGDSAAAAAAQPAKSSAAESTSAAESATTITDPNYHASDDTAALAPVKDEPPTDKPRKLLGKLVFWGLIAWILAYCAVLLGAFTVQFLEGEFPCPLCMLQRYAMILSSLAAMWIVMQAKRGTLTMGRYAQGLGLGLLASAAGAVESGRQILLHIKPFDPGYGSAVLGLHLYTWAMVTFFIVMVFVAVLLVIMPKAVPVAPKAKGIGHIGNVVATAVIWLFMVLIFANVIAIIFLEGFAWVLPDDPTSYNLLDQLGITN